MMEYQQKKEKRQNIANNSLDVIKKKAPLTPTVSQGVIHLRESKHTGGRRSVATPHRHAQERTQVTVVSGGTSSVLLLLLFGHIDCCFETCSFGAKYS